MDGDATAGTKQKEKVDKSITVRQQLIKKVKSI
jgi:hypothetical protein